MSPDSALIGHLHRNLEELQALCADLQREVVPYRHANAAIRELCDQADRIAGQPLNWSSQVRAFLPPSRLEL